VKENRGNESKVYNLSIESSGYFNDEGGAMAARPQEANLTRGEAHSASGLSSALAGEAGSSSTLFLRSGRRRPRKGRPAYAAQGQLRLVVVYAAYHFFLFF